MSSCHGVSGTRPRVLMLVINPMTADARVEREAAALGGAGYGVTVVALAGEGLPSQEARDGYTLVRRPYRRVTRDTILARRARARRRLPELVRGLEAVAAHAPRTEWRRTRVLARAYAYGVRLLALRARLEHAASDALLRLVRSRLLVRDYWRSIACDLPSVIARCDVVHAHDLGTLAAAVRLARHWSRADPDLPPTRVVYDSHELYLDQNTKWRGPERALWALHERRWIRKADEIITVSDGIARALRRRYLLRAAPVVVINAPDDAQRQATERDVRSDAGVGRSTPLVVYIGAAKPGRGVDRLIPALARGDGWHLVLVGAGESEHVEEVLRASVQAGVADRVHALPAVAPAELTGYVATADVGVHPMEPVCRNHELALPNKLFTYVFARLPVAVSALPEMTGFVRRYGVGLTFDPYDEQSVADAIGDLARQRPRYAPSDEVLRRIEAAYGWREQERRLLAVYARLVSAPSASDLRPRGRSAEGAASAS